MNLFLMVALALVAFALLVQEMVFLSFLVLVALVIAAYYYSSPREAPIPQELDEPLVIKTKGFRSTPEPEFRDHYQGKLYKIRIYPTWENRSMWEEMGKNFTGEVGDTVGATLYRLATGKHSDAGKDMAIEKTFRGR